MKACEDLRQAVLQAAIQGKLTKQLPEDGDAKDLLAEIRAEKERLIEEGKLKKSKALPEITEEEIPFDIPENWQWVRLGNLFNINPRNKADDDDEAGFIPMAMIGDGFKNYHDFQVKKWGSIKKGFTHFMNDDVVMAKITPCFENRKSVIIKNLPNAIGSGTTELHVFRDDTKILDMGYLLFLVKSSWFIDKAAKNFKGTAGQQRIGKDYVENSLFPLPPLAEQERIVAKVDALLSRIDDLEKTEAALEKLKAEFPSDMKASLLQAAIQGKLTEQLADDGTAAELLAEIKAEKEKLIKEGKLKKSKVLPEITEDEIPFDIPDNWQWVKLGEVVNKLTDGAHKTPKYTLSGIPFVSVKNISSGVLDFRNTKFISPKEHEELFKRCNPERNDLLLSKVGTTGVPAKVDTDEQFSLFVSVALLKFDINLIDIDFFIYAILSPVVQKQCEEHTRGVGNKNWVMNDIANTILPLPPLAEQKRIVAKLEQLLPLCDGLVEK